MDLEIDIYRLSTLKGRHQKEQYQLQDDVNKRFPQQITALNSRIGNNTKDLSTFNENRPQKKGDFSVVLANKTLNDKKEANEMLAKIVGKCELDKPTKIGTYMGFDIINTRKVGIQDYATRNAEIVNHCYLKGNEDYHMNSKADSWISVSKLDNALAKIEQNLNETRDRLENTKSQLEKAKLEIGKPFARENELREKQARKIEIDLAINNDSSNEEPVNEIVDCEPIEETTEKISVMEQLKAIRQEQGESKQSIYKNISHAR